MENHRRRREYHGELTRRATLGLAGAVLLAAPALAETYPDRPIRWIVPFSAGGGGDILVRVIGQELGDRLGQPVVIDNRTGAGGNVGTDAVARSRPDGYTLLMANVAPMAINVTLYRDLPYDPVRSFAPVSPLAVFPNVLVVRPALGVGTLSELIALGKSRSGGLSYASAGSGSITHLAAEMLAAQAGLEVLHVAYRGGGPALVGLASGDVDMYFSSLPAALPFLANGQLRAIGVTSAHLAASAPDIPTIVESGLPGFEADTWIGLVAPAGTPAPIVERLNQEIRAILGQDSLKRRMIELGAEASYSSADDFGRYIKAEVARWSASVRAARLEPQ